MKTLDEIIAALKAANDSLMALLDLAAPTEEQVAEAKSLASTVEDLKRQKSEAEARIEQKQAAIELQKQLDADARKSAQRINDLPISAASNDEPRVTSNARTKSRHFKSNQDAITSAHFLKAALGSKGDLDWLVKNAPKHVDTSSGQIHLKASTLNEGSDYYGGILVPTEMEQVIINLREEYGVFRKYADIKTMSSAQRTVPKTTANTTFYSASEASTLTQTDKQWRNIILNAKPFGGYIKYSNELNEDSLINFADDVAQDFAASAEQKLDACAFIGDGTSTYEGIIGLSQYNIWLDGQNGGSWTSNDTSKAYHGAVYTSSATTWASLVAADIDGTIWKARRYAGMNGVLFCHQQFYAQVIDRLKTAVGGVTATEITNGWNGSWKGTPVVFVDCMPSTTAADTVPLIYGDLKKGAMLGDRIGFEMETQSTGTDWISNIITVKARARWDIQVHDMGNYNSTAGSRKSGAITALAIKHS